jgi:iron uptake system EfeUOB component EfeO/EfeM
MLRPRASALVAAAVAVAAVPAGCSDGDDGKAAGTPPAQSFSARDPTPSHVPRASPADYRRPIAAYRRHVRRQLGAMLLDVDALRTAAARGDLADARSAWLRADGHYETIGAAYGAFGDLDGAINGRTAGLALGARSPDFTGLHRVELELWKRRSTARALPYVERLAGDVQRLRSKIGRMEIDPLEYALRSHEVLEDTLHLQLSGLASPWSGSALYALRSNLVGTRVVLRTLRPMIVRRDPQVFAQARRALAKVDAALRDLTGRSGSLPRWDALDMRSRERIGGLTAAAAERLAYVPELIDPRPLLPSQRAFGEGS